VAGKIQEAKSFEDFDYKKYLERFNVYAVSGFDKILILKSHRLSPVKEFFLKVKAAFIKRADELMPAPNNSLLVSILIGAHKNLPQNIVDNFNTTGTSHIIAVSGFNITIIISALASLAFLIGRRAGFWLSLSALAGFLIITGLSASVLRAAIMGFLLLVALNAGRQYSIVPALFFAGLIMLIINPKILYWDVGFQLSFAATLGIVYFLPLLNKLTEKIPEYFGVKSLLLTTLSAIVATMPLILFSFGNLSLSAPIVNILILPAVPSAMLLGFLIFIPFLGSGFAYAANLLLMYMTKVLAFFSGLPYSCLNFQISVWIFWLLNLTVFGIYFLLLRLAKRQSLALSKKQEIR
jgi:competence protein ComEC